METESKRKQLLTDDGIPVRTIYLSNLHGTTSLKDLKNFCKDKFGPVSTVRIHQLKNQNQNPRHLRSYVALAYAFVTFVDTDSAYKAVSKTPQLHFNGRLLRISKADSWHQPTERDANVAGPSGSTSAMLTESQNVTEKLNTTSAPGDFSPLVSINDDCLHEIFNYLNIFDTVNVASTCKRLRCFVTENLYPKYVKFELKPDLTTDRDEKLNVTLYILRTMLQHFGSIVEEFDLHGTTFSDCAGRRHLQYVLKYCPNLHTLRLRFFTFRDRDQIPLSKVSSNIRVLELYECDGITDDWTDFLRNFSALRTLIIYKNNEITGTIFNKCKNLESLELIYCQRVVVQQLNKFCKANGSSMRTLKLLSCPYLDHTLFQMITSKLPRIEDLTIELTNVTGPNQLNCLAELNYLKKLFIVCSMFNIGTYLRLLGDRGLLEELAIYGGTLDAETCGTIQKFPRLQTLKLLYPISENEHMMDIIENADLPELREFYCEACNSITNGNLVAVVTSKRHLETVDILFSNSVTFAAVVSIIDVLKSDTDRPHLKMNIDTFEIGDEEKKILKDNRELITVTTMTTCTKLDENYPDAFDLYDDMSDDMDDDHDFYIEDDDDDDESYDDYMFGLAMHGGGSDDEYDEALKYFDAIF